MRDLGPYERDGDERPLLDGSDPRDALLTGLLFSVNGLIDEVRALRDRMAQLEAHAFRTSAAPRRDSDK